MVKIVITINYYEDSVRKKAIVKRISGKPSNQRH